MKRTRRKATTPGLIVAGYRDLELVNPRLATWRCRCRLINQVCFGRDAATGYAFPNMLVCTGCNTRYRGRLVLEAESRTANPQSDLSPHVLPAELYSSCG